MPKFTKKMCKAAKDGYKQHEDDILSQARDARFLCKRCLRVAEDKKLICDPVKLHKKKDRKADSAKEP